MVAIVHSLALCVCILWLAACVAVSATGARVIAYARAPDSTNPVNWLDGALLTQIDVANKTATPLVNNDVTRATWVIARVHALFTNGVATLISLRVFVTLFSVAFKRAADHTFIRHRLFSSRNSNLFTRPVSTHVYWSDARAAIYRLENDGNNGGASAHANVASQHLVHDADADTEAAVTGMFVTGDDEMGTLYFTRDTTLYSLSLADTRLATGPLSISECTVVLKATDDATAGAAAAGDANGLALLVGTPVVLSETPKFVVAWGVIANVTDANNVTTMKAVVRLTTVSPTKTGEKTPNIQSVDIVTKPLVSFNKAREHSYGATLLGALPVLAYDWSYTQAAATTTTAAAAAAETKVEKKVDVRFAYAIALSAEAGEARTVTFTGDGAKMDAGSDVAHVQGVPVSLAVDPISGWLVLASVTFGQFGNHWHLAAAHSNTTITVPRDPGQMRTRLLASVQTLPVSPAATAIAAAAAAVAANGDVFVLPSLRVLVAARPQRPLDSYDDAIVVTYALNMTAVTTAIDEKDAKYNVAFEPWRTTRFEGAGAIAPIAVDDAVTTIFYSSSRGLDEKLRGLQRLSIVDGTMPAVFARNQTHKGNGVVGFVAGSNKLIVGSSDLRSQVSGVNLVPVDEPKKAMSLLDSSPPHLSPCDRGASDVLYADADIIVFHSHASAYATYLYTAADDTCVLIQLADRQVCDRAYDSDRKLLLSRCGSFRSGSWLSRIDANPSSPTFKERHALFSLRSVTVAFDTLNGEMIALMDPGRCNHARFCQQFFTLSLLPHTHFLFFFVPHLTLPGEHSVTYVLHTYDYTLPFNKKMRAPPPTMTRVLGKQTNVALRFATALQYSSDKKKRAIIATTYRGKAKFEGQFSQVLRIGLDVATVESVNVNPLYQGQAAHIYVDPIGDGYVYYLAGPDKTHNQHGHRLLRFNNTQSQPVASADAGYATEFELVLDTASPAALLVVDPPDDSRNAMLLNMPGIAQMLFTPQAMFYITSRSILYSLPHPTTPLTRELSKAPVAHGAIPKYESILHILDTSAPGSVNKTGVVFALQRNPDKRQKKTPPALAYARFDVPANGVAQTQSIAADSWTVWFPTVNAAVFDTTRNQLLVVRDSMYCEFSFAVIACLPKHVLKKPS
jgi:hypothetical protein